MSKMVTTYLKKLIEPPVDIGKKEFEIDRLSIRTLKTPS
jgi:hypothetical protein